MMFKARSGADRFTRHDLAWSLLSKHQISVVVRSGR
jgi:hypothetical protein